jgi:hypothetical protein
VDALEIPHTRSTSWQRSRRRSSSRKVTASACSCRITASPVGFRIISRLPERAEWLIIQNSNAYEEGFTPAWDGIRNALGKRRGSDTETPLLPFLALDGTKMLYLHGHKRPELISPDNWNTDFQFMERTNARATGSVLRLRTNVDLYPRGRTSSAGGGRRR